MDAGFGALLEQGGVTALAALIIWGVIWYARSNSQIAKEERDQQIVRAKERAEEAKNEFMLEIQRNEERHQREMLRLQEALERERETARAYREMISESQKIIGQNGEIASRNSAAFDRNTAAFDRNTEAFSNTIALMEKIDRLVEKIDRHFLPSKPVRAARKVGQDDKSVPVRNA